MNYCSPGNKNKPKTFKRNTLARVKEEDDEPWQYFLQFISLCWEEMKMK